ncbi:MAG: thrombospondin type 3 repeat-containing protein, partial [Myxococcota bacterium]
LKEGARLRLMTPNNPSLTGDFFYVDDVFIGCDTDNDGLPNFKELRVYGSDPNLADTDGDGVDDRQEIIDGTDPTRFPPIDLPVQDNFETGTVDLNFWLSDPVGDSEVSMNFANAGGASADMFSLRLGDNGGELQSLDIDFLACQGTVAWDFRLKTGEMMEEPEADDLFSFDVFNRATLTYESVVQRVGGTPLDFVPIIGNSDAETFLTANGTQIRFFTPADGANPGDSWYVDEFYIDCDSDGDLLPDNKEVLVYGTDPQNGDVDGDGIIDGAEVIQGTNPAGVLSAPEIDEDFSAGAVDLAQWQSAPVGDAAVSTTFANSDTFSLRVGDGGGSLESVELDFISCGNAPGTVNVPVAWDFRLKAGEGAEEPEPSDILEAQVFNRLTQQWDTFLTTTGGIPFDFDPILGNSTELAFSYGSTVRIITQDTSATGGGDAWYIDDIAFGCDADGDLIPDNIEASRYGTDPTLADSDGDGIDDGAEVVAGTNPSFVPLAPELEDDFATGAVDATLWTGAPTGDADVSTNFANTDTFSLRLGDAGGALTSVDLAFPDCAGDVAWDFRLKTGEATEEPDALDVLEVQVFVRTAQTWTPLATINGGTVFDFDPILGNATDPAFSLGTMLRFVTQDTAVGGDSDAWYIDDIAVGCDDDSDLIPDFVELSRYGTDPTVQDTDGDGVIDGDEIAAGTNPSGFILEAFETGVANASIWTAQPTGDAVVTTTFANSDIYSLQLGDAGGSLTSATVDFAGLCGAGVPVAFDLFARTAEGTEVPEIGDDVLVEVFDTVTSSYVTIGTIPGDGTPLTAFTRFQASSTDAAFATPTDIRISSIGNGDGDLWYIDDIVVDCDPDADAFPSFVDNCPLDSNPLQEDMNGNGIGDICDCMPASLLTTLAAGNGQNGNMFDIVAITEVIIDDFEISPSVGAGTSLGVEIYTKTGSHVGFETNAAAWTLLGNTTVISNGPGQTTPVPINVNVTIPVGQTAAFYVTSTTGTILNYSNGSNPNGVFIQNANMQVL